MMAPDATKASQVAAAMAELTRVHQVVGGDVVSGGGTGTWHVNRGVTELQAGSFTLMDAEYARAGLPFRQAVHLWATVVSTRPGRWAVADAGLKALGMDHGGPEVQGYRLFYVSDEHTTFVRDDGTDGAPDLPRVGDRVRLVPGHLDPTVAYHDRLHLVEGDAVVGEWPVDLRGW
jgi:D-serine deaminase-like pyridoxal phosphate-dependent protein